ncbi:chitosanase [Streptomyces fuscigenes]|uniref:chitosanase n=1 Tax=Streptomyces fuscigenes TaxID=1528880 RepID=UPI001F1B4155|nr:chitosanase [Streptomyces fuscigenes]MCF3962350.1 chitosanase [Streptomyces fuscigenes]
MRRALPLLAALALTCAAACSAGAVGQGPGAARAVAAAGLDAPAEKDVAMRLVSSAENSTLDWRAQYGYIEDIGDGRGYTAGLIGFCTGCGDLLHVVEAYDGARPGSALARYLPALRRLAAAGSASHDGLGEGFVAAWVTAAKDPRMRAAQDTERDTQYFDPAVDRAKKDGLGALGQFFYYDAVVMHGNGHAPTSFGSIRRRALRAARTPAEGGGEKAYLAAFLEARVWAMRQEPDHHDTSRVDTEQRVFLNEGNLDLRPPLKWKVYGDSYRIER